MGSPLDGKRLAARVRDEVRGAASAFARESGRPPGLALVLVGDDPVSLGYTRGKERWASEVGIAARLYALPTTTSEGELLAFVERLNADDAVDGVLVQLPLPAGIEARRVLDAVRPEKDVDGLHPLNVGLLAAGRPALTPCTPRGILRLLAEAGAELAGARAVVIGRSQLVGRPAAQLLLAADATVTLAHTKTAGLAALCRDADVLIAAAGRAGLVRGDWVKPGAVVIDVGVNRGPDGKVVGDVVFAEALERASWVTPVPGGVGPMTVACLLENTLIAARARLGAVR